MSNYSEDQDSFAWNNCLMQIIPAKTYSSEWGKWNTTMLTSSGAAAAAWAFFSVF